MRILDEHVPLYRRLPDEDRRELHGHIHVFLGEKRFEGCAGLEITDEIRLTIAAQACVLLLHRETDYYPSLWSILVYPSTYVAPVAEQDEAGIVSEFEEDRAGETWEEGSLVLSWDDVTGTAEAAPPLEDGEDSRPRPGNGGPRDRHSHDDVIGVLSDDDDSAGAPEAGELVPAYNVVLHEFAHQLDLENGELDGAPGLDSREHYESWARALDAGLDQLESEVESGVEPVIDEYALEDDAEFFAVVTESFFETPFALLEEYPKVYDALKSYYRQDPAAW